MTLKTKISSLLLAVIMLLDMFTVFPTDIFAVEADEPSAETTQPQEQEEDSNESYIEGLVKITCEGSNSVQLEKGDKLYAFTTLDPSLDSRARYSWELKTSSGKWATVSGYVFYYAVISEALLYNAALIDGAAKIRCIVTIGENKYVSDVLSVTPPAASDSITEYFDSGLQASEDSLLLAAPATRAPMGDDPDLDPDPENTPEVEEETEADAPVIDTLGGGNTDSNIFQIVINYTYRHATLADSMKYLDGTNAANTFTVTLPPNTYYTGTIVTPPEIGYLPYVKLDQAQYVLGINDDLSNLTDDMKIVYGKDENDKDIIYVPAQIIEFNNQSENVTINVYFIPQKVTFRVKIFEQNLLDDEYTLAETITKTAIANTAVGEGHDEPRYGFTSLFYDPKTPIDEDGFFAIDIYYDRNYYLVDFDLNDKDESYGVTNHYARYESTAVLPPPTRPGYSFNNWTLTSVTEIAGGGQVTTHGYPLEANGGYVISSLKHNLNYQANWSEGKTSYTVIYWLENADDDGFTLDSFKVVSAVPGDEVSAPDDLSIPDKNCFTFDKTLSDENVVVSGDGTTAVNAYYLRKYYTMSFKGTSTCITLEHTHDATCNLDGKCELTAHAHTNKCRQEKLICEKQVHTHDAECEQNENECALEVHVHTSTCYSYVLKCEQEEHTHVDTCCTIDEHAHDSSCCDIAYHVHGEGANSDCLKPEHPLHHDMCYSRVQLKEADGLTNTTQKNAYTTLKQKVTGPLNGYVYKIRPSRGSNTTVYNFLYVHNKWFYLGTGTDYNGVTVSRISNPGNSAGSTSSGKASTICGYELHTHGDGTCTCTITEHDHTSGCTCEKTRHVHGEGNCNNTECGMTQHRHSISLDCYEYNCGLSEHTHGGNCQRACQKIEHTHTTGNNGCQTKKDQTFLTFKAKYNADISKIWTKIGEQFGNGERWSDSKKTYFKYVLVYAPFMPPANIEFTVDGGSSTNPLYTINYYLESLGTGTPTPYQNKYFDLSNTIKAKYGYLTPAEDFFDIPGFTQFASDPAESGGQIKDTKDYEVSLYYSRNEYELEFVSLGTTLSTRTQVLKYQQPIGESFEVLPENVPYPSNKEPGELRFVGWYYTPNCADGTEFVFDGSVTMPIGGLVLYAKWEVCSYTVNIYAYADKGADDLIDTQTVLFDSFITEPDYTLIQHPGGLPEHEHPGYDDEDHRIFLGWYYMEDGKEKRFDFNTMSVKFDMEIYAKWTSRIPVNFTIRYVYLNAATGTYVDIAQPRTGASLAGATKQFTAKVGNDLYDKYRVYYFPELRSHSMTMSSNKEENVFLFVYSTQDKITYYVNHEFTDKKADSNGQTVFAKYLKGSNTLTLTKEHTITGEDLTTQAASVAVSFREAVTKENVTQAARKINPALTDDQATEIWNVIVDMSPDFFIKNLILTTDPAQNHATFEWTDADDQVLYQIIYYQESVDGTEYLIAAHKTDMVTAGTSFDLTPFIDNPDGEMIKNFEHFTFDKNNPNNILQGTANKPVPDANTGVLSKGLVLKLYYTRNEYTYTIQHKDQSSSIVMKTETGTAKYQQVIFAESVAKEFPGYTYVIDPNDNGTTITGNGQTIVCSYLGLKVNYQYQVIGVGGTIQKTQDGDQQDSTDTVTIGGDDPKSKKLVLWNDGYVLSGWYYAIDDGERKPVPKEWLSDNNMVVTPLPPDVDLAGKTVYVYAEVIPTTRRFSVEGFATPENDPQAFVFNLKGTAGTATSGVDVTFVIYDDGYIDISYLPYGEYTLTTLHWAWRLDHPTTVTFNDETHTVENGMVTLELDTTGDVIIHYPSKYNDKWLSDDASGTVPLHSVSPHRAP